MVKMVKQGDKQHCRDGEQQGDMMKPCIKSQEMVVNR
jgi:hypothetical protein